VPCLALPELAADGVYVLELSSYQLELTPSLACTVAVLLNIAPDHLERHGGMGGYIAAKGRIFNRQGPSATAVVGVDDPASRTIAESLRHRANGPRVVPVSATHAVAEGVFVQDGMMFDATNGAGPVAVLDLADAAALPGTHNAQNAVAAWASARALGIERNMLADAMRTFPGLAHRQERIATIDGVTWINDSKATNPDATARALACYDAIYWIAGGRAKSGSLDALRPHLEHVRHAYLIGEAAETFAAELGPEIPTTVAGTLDRAVAAAQAQAHRNGVKEPVVLLSPACASFDQFRDFEDRGDTFRALVEGLRP
jgi:UDP-N-acetylmuramoylalanine--D-glutamate ligase